MFGNPFGLSEATDTAIANQLKSLVSVFRRVSMAPATVVLIDQNSLDRLHDEGKGWLSTSDWPISYSDHARILKQILSEKEKPATIFYDVLFQKERERNPGLRVLGRLAEKASSAYPDLKIYFAGGGETVAVSRVVMEKLYPIQLLPVSWVGDAGVYPVQGSLSTDPERRIFLPAAKMYTDHCAKRSADCTWIRNDKMPDMVLDYGLARTSQCKADWNSLLVRSLKLAFGAETSESLATADCLPFNIVRLVSLFDSVTTTLRPPWVNPGDPYVVLVGVTLDAVNDYYATPVYDDIAGVFVHAYGFENLVRMQGDYIRSVDTSILSACIVVVITALAWSRKKSRKDDAGGSVKDFFIETLFTFLFFSVAYLLFYMFIRASFENWLSLMVLIPFIRNVVIKYEAKYADE